MVKYCYGTYKSNSETPVGFIFKCDSDVLHDLQKNASVLQLDIGTFSHNSLTDIDRFELFRDLEVIKRSNRFDIPNFLMERTGSVINDRKFIKVI